MYKRLILFIVTLTYTSISINLQNYPIYFSVLIFNYLSFVKEINNKTTTATLL